MQDAVAVDMLSAERAMLVRFCARYSGSADAAEDLAQQTLLEALRRQHQLRDPAARRGWLLAIARTTCLDWGRARSRELARRADLSGAERGEPGDALADSFDLEMELDLADLARLLDRAMALLPPQTRDALVWRYVEESPQAEVAERLGLSEGAVEARLHRGKLALRKLLTTELADEAAAHGLISPGAAGWQETRIWCPACGRRFLLGRFNNRRELVLNCPDCTGPSGMPVVNSRGIELLCGADSSRLFADIEGFKPALNRILAATHGFYARGIAGRTVRCYRCGGDVRLRPSRWQVSTRHHYVATECRSCGWTDGIGSVVWRALERPEGRAFWREHGRIRMLPDREVDAAGGPAIVSTLESVTGAGTLEVVFVRDTLEVIAVHRS